MGKVLDIAAELLKTLLIPKHELEKTDGLNSKNLRAFLERRGISEFLLYRYYEEFEKDGQDIGIYTMSDKRKGIIFQVFPSPYSGKTIEESIANLVDSAPDNSVVFINTFAGRNIKNQIDEFAFSHQYTPNIKNPEVLKELITDYEEFLKYGINESIVKGIDVRVKHFTSTVGILFPEEITKEEISQFYFEMIGVLSSLSPRNFDGTSLLRMLKEMLNPDANIEEWNTEHDIHRKMSKQVVFPNTKIKTNDDKGYFEVGKWNYKVLSTFKFPNEKRIIDSFDFYNAFFDRFRSKVQPPIPCPFYTSLVINIGEKEKNVARALAKSRDDYSKTRKIKKSEREKNPELELRYQEARRNIELMTNHNQTPFYSKFSITLMEQNASKLSVISEKLKSKFRERDWYIEEENFGNVALFLFLFGLPLQANEFVDEFLNKDDLLFTSNTSSIAPLFGNNIHNNLVEPYFDSNWELIPYDSFSLDSYNAVKTGITGQGKSYSQCFSHIFNLSYGIKLRIIDKGYSYKRFCEIIGGEMIDVAKDPNLSLNLFTKARTKKIINSEGEETEKNDFFIDENNNELMQLHPEEVTSIVGIFGIAVGIDLLKTGKEGESVTDATEKSYLLSILHKLVNEAFLLHQRNTKFEHVRELIDREYKKEKTKGNEKHASLLLNIYIGLYNIADKQGSYYNLYNKPGNVNFDNDYLVIETEGLEGVILDIVVVTLASAIRQEFWREGVDRKKRLEIDEGWNFKDKPLVVSILDNNARTLRKSMSGQTFITQMIEDFDTNDSMRALFKNSVHKILLGQNEDDIEKLNENSFFPLTPLKKALYKSISLKKGFWGEFLYNTPHGAIPLLLKASPKLHWVASGANPSGNKLFDATRKKHSLNFIETARFLAKKDENQSLSDEELLVYAKKFSITKKMSDLEEEKFWKKELENAQKYNLLRVRAEPVLKKIDKEEDNIFGYEIFSFINHADGSESSFGRYYKWVEYFGLENIFQEMILKKAFKYFEDSDVMLHININSNQLQNTEFLKILERQMLAYKISDRVILELKDTATNNNIEEIIVFINRFKQHNVKFAIDNVDAFYHKMSYIAILDVDYIKIDGSLIKEAMNDESKKTTLEAIVVLAGNSNHKKTLISSKIENIEEKSFLKHFEINIFQGRVVKKNGIII